MMRKIFYDFEVFKHNWMVVLIDYDTKKGKVIVDDVDELKRFYKMFKDDIWIGYNSRMYDQYILKGILLGMNPYYISSRIINDNVKGFNVVREGYKIPLNNFDITTGFHSLKQLEGFMGSRIKESSVPFDISRALTEKEIKEVVDYCIHDVKQTIEVFDNKKEEFESQLALIEAFDLEMSMFTKTKAQLSAFILGAEKQGNRGDEFELRFPNTLKIEKYKHIVDWYRNPENLDYKKNLKVDVAGVPHIFAWGGLHGALPKYKDEGIILCCDVASLYPSIMIEYDYISRNVKNPLKYTEIRDTRLELKRKKDPKQAPYKIVLNSTYGAMKDQYNPLYDPLMANNVCLAGQLLLLDLIEKIEPYCKLIQSNTDGLFMKVEKESDIDLIKEVAKEWETRTRLDLEWDVYEKIYQKDVNNYIIIDKDQKYKSKGAYVKKLNNLDYDLPIVNKAMIEYFTKDIPVEKTINECDQLREFQKISKVSNKYMYALYGEERLPEKVLRVFASNDEDAKGVFKVKTEERIEKIGNTPPRCFINNDNVIDLKVPAYLDKEYYIEIAKKRINDYLGISNKKKTKKEM
ncbi:DNA polymerase domain-containing protein [Bacillus amyloliquefaciens]|uniref:DNA polymerase domain-containing protein n=1 Tax=Bacillus amyloliquefaciens TaxID=1390 RepID=UPI00164EE758|nr:DNA polymerase domain-containing protein [Bacillus amyloliquefaciens]WBY35358.1 DNA polymerase domain-containing protein [Bacillus amyloliquefaciens]